MNPLHCLFSLLLAGACVIPAGAGTTLAFGSSVGGVNLTSTGDPLDRSFEFQVGTFTDGFVPSASNTREWIRHWQMLPGATATYCTDPLGDPFPPAFRLNNFSVSVTVTDNPAPFASGAPLFLWGFDRRNGAGLGEWILLSDPAWVCPEGEGIRPALSWNATDAGIVLVGALNQGEVGMRTNKVTLTPPPESLAEWRSRHFPAEVSITALEAAIWGSQADPDNDLVPNLVECYLGSDPKVVENDALPNLSQDDSGLMVLRYRRSAVATGIQGGVEWSSNLKDWTREGLAETIVGNDGQGIDMEVRLADLTAKSAFFKIWTSE